MVKILICYCSKSGNTKKMAYLIRKGVMEEDVEVDTKDVQEVKIDESLRGELNALARNDVPGLLIRPPERSLQESPDSR